MYCTSIYVSSVEYWDFHYVSKETIVRTESMSLGFASASADCWWLEADCMVRRAADGSAMDSENVAANSARSNKHSDLIVGVQLSYRVVDERSARERRSESRTAEAECTVERPLLRFESVAATPICRRE